MEFSIKQVRRPDATEERMHRSGRVDLRNRRRSCSHRRRKAAGSRVAAALTSPELHRRGDLDAEAAARTLLLHDVPGIAARTRAAGRPRQGASSPRSRQFRDGVAAAVAGRSRTPARRRRALRLGTRRRPRDVAWAAMQAARWRAKPPTVSSDEKQTGREPQAACSGSCSRKPRASQRRPTRGWRAASPWPMA